LNKTVPVPVPELTSNKPPGLVVPIPTLPVFVSTNKVVPFTVKLLIQKSG